MRKIAPVAVVIAAVLVACAPATITPEELVVSMPYDEAFAEVSHTINTQPYPGDTSGWVLEQSDQVGGFISTVLHGRHCRFLLGCEDYTARVSVALNERGDTRTAVNVSRTGHEVARELADRITERLSDP